MTRARSGTGADGAKTGNMSPIGGRHGRIDGGDQVTGRAQYADDLAPPRMLFARILRSPHAHAHVVGLDTRKALALDGVEAVITGRDLPTPYGVLPWTEDEHVLAVERVRYVGDAVAAVAAVDEATADAACAAIEVAYAPLPALLNPEDAASRTDVQLHTGKRPGNLTKQVDLAFGDVDAAAAEAAVVVEGDYFFQGTTHAAIEPHCALAEVDGSGVVTVWSATQVPHYLHRALAQVLEVPARQVRVIQPPVGGGFGGKSEPFDLEFCAALLAMRTGRPVKVLYTREEVFLAHRGRHPTRIRAKTSFAEDGRLLSATTRTCSSTAAPTRASAWSPPTTRGSSPPSPMTCPPTATGAGACTPTSPPAAPSAATGRCSRASPWRCSSTGRRRRWASIPSSFGAGRSSASRPAR